MAIEVMYQPLDMPDTEALRAEYGVEFVEATPNQTSDFGAMCDRLLQERIALDGQCANVGIVATGPAVIYQPSVFLATKPTTEQIKQINDHETGRVADYTVGVQAELAKVPIVESGDRMVDLRTWFAAEDVATTFSDKPYHAACGEWAGQPRVFWAREGFAQRLALMGRLLDTADVDLHFEDAFRPVGVQEGLFKRRVAWTKADHPDWTDEQIITEAQSKTAVKPRLASHKGGAAADARLRDRATNELLDFGHEYPDGGALVFPRTPFITAEQWRNRQLFQVAAGLSGLTLYVGEDWHVSYGDNLGSLDEHGQVRPDYVAQYGPIKDFDRRDGTITAIYGPNEMDQVFDH